MNSLVTIITPCYNGEEFLDKYFGSILAQTYKNLELIFVNDGSTDRTEEIALSYRSALEQRGITFKYLYQPNGGQAKAMNTGFKEMTGKYLVWPDSDDLLSPDSIEKRVDFLEQNPDFAWVRSNVDAFDYETGEFLYRFAVEEDKCNKDIFMDLIMERTYCCCCYMVRVSALREIYPDLHILESRQGQNWQILIPMAGRYECGYVDGDLYHYAVRNNSHSRVKKDLEQEVSRWMGLKEILLDGIMHSGRTDRDYQQIVELKYEQILFQVYMRFSETEKAKACYCSLEEANVVQEQDKCLYLQTFQPVRYKFHCVKRLSGRAVRKIKRILFGKK